ncbi:thioredoxin domain-containing protein [Salinibacterium sp. M195]|uniref:DsbA family protein n=1 Tax=Salinibacterium sp. M195 TaxID=2583374 RepID=UPI001C6288E4|nr:thioredoxin domain-containing protein [Salinibacterium sp. M195]QYH35695.1 protein-disulfide isomerase [Salinibacterium sp. M195]
MKKALLPTLVALGVLVIIAVGVFIYVSVNSTGTSPTADSPDGSATTTSSAVASDSRYLDDVGPDAVTVVEFLDFECSACGQFYPYVEGIREYYDGEINYVVRYFPLPNHPHSMEAAVSAEAAGQQGEFEAMYHKLFETQADWGFADGPQAATFRDYAAELGLDLELYDASVADPETQARVEADFADGQELGVESTPSFFVNDKLIEIQSVEDLPEAIKAALEQQ